ncbi:MAG: efflux RND transporter periplasmic adaptor subunit [Acidobacteriota bacterium]
MNEHIRRACGGIAVTAAFLAAAGASAAAPPAELPPSPVRYTQAQEYAVRRTVRLPGTVASRTSSLVASEVEGLVEKFLAREGDTVRKGQPLALLRTTRLELQKEAAVAQLAEAESRLHLATLNLERTRGLFEQEVASQQDFDNARYEHSAWQGRVEALRAQIARIQVDIDDCTIRAPFAGLVVSEKTEIGEWIAAGGPVIELMSLSDIEVRVDVPERYFSALNPGAMARVSFDAILDLTVEGKITAVIARADPRARTFPLKVRIANPEGRIGVGMLAHVSFPAGESYRATVVPKDAVVQQGEAKFVYLIKGDDTVDMVPVETGEGVGSWIVVRGGVLAGQKVITRGNERLQPRLPVRGEPMEYALP